MIKFINFIHPVLFLCATKTQSRLYLSICLPLLRCWRQRQRQQHSKTATTTLSLIQARSKLAEAFAPSCRRLENCFENYQNYRHLHAWIIFISLALILALRSHPIRETCVSSYYSCSLWNCLLVVICAEEEEEEEEPKSSFWGAVKNSCCRKDDLLAANLHQICHLVGSFSLCLVEQAATTRTRTRTRTATKTTTLPAM